MKIEQSNPGSIEPVTLDSLAEIVNAFVRERGWEKFHSPKNLAMSIAIEAAELMEHFQWDDANQLTGIVANDSPVAEEMADVLAYLLRLATVLGVDMTSALALKMQKNQLKYPVGSDYVPQRPQYL